MNVFLKFNSLTDANSFSLCPLLLIVISPFEGKKSDCKSKHITPYICVYKVLYFAFSYPLDCAEGDEQKSKHVATVIGKLFY
jgi:hypothetical protein